MISSVRCPVFSRKRHLSIVLICSHRITESEPTPAASLQIETCVGSAFFVFFAVIAATIVVGAKVFPASF